MDLAPPVRHRRIEPVLPMVNLVFLLLIFFLMAAVLAPRPPLPVAAPAAAGVMPFQPARLRLSLTADGALAYREVTGAAAMARLARDLAGPAPAEVALHADRGAPARAVARALRDLAAAGAGPVLLVAEPAR